MGLIWVVEEGGNLELGSKVTCNVLYSLYSIYCRIYWGSPKGYCLLIPLFYRTTLCSMFSRLLHYDTYVHELQKRDLGDYYLLLGRDVMLHIKHWHP